MPNNSGEFSVLLSTLTDMRSESNAFRATVDVKLDNQSKQNTDILVKLSEHNGRLNMMQMSLDTLKAVGEENKIKLENIESNTPTHTLAAVEHPVKKSLISWDNAPTIFVALAAAVAFVISVVSVVRHPSTAPALLTAPVTVDAPK